MSDAESLARAAALRESAEALVPELAGRVAETEKLRRLPEATIADVKAAGLHRMAVPRRLGGAELPLDQSVDIVSVLARGCASTAWVCGVYTDHSIIAGMFDDPMADEIWGNDPDAMIAAGYLPSGAAVRDGDGWRLSGRWGYGSGCDFASWLLFGALLPDATGSKAAHLCFVPRAEVTIDDNWHVMGLEGTGSKDMLLDDVFVPARRTIPFAHVNGGAEARGRTDVPPLYRLPHITSVPFLFCGTALGIAESLRDTLRGSMEGRGSRNGPVRDFQVVQLRFAEASAEIDTARLVVERGTRGTMAIMEEGRSLTLDERARNRRDIAYAGRLCRQAVERLVSISGTEGIYDSHVAQRKFRDMATASRHVSFNWDIAGTTFGRVSFGLDPGTPMI